MADMLVITFMSFLQWMVSEKLSLTFSSEPDFQISSECKYASLFIHEQLHSMQIS